MSKNEKIPLTKNIEIGGLPHPCYELFSRIDPGTRTPEMVLLVEYLDNNEVKIERILVSLGIPIEEKMSLQEFNRQKRIALGLEVIPGINIPGRQQNIPCEDSFMVVAAPCGESLYGLIETNLETGMVKIVRYDVQIGTSIVTEISVEKYSELKASAENQIEDRMAEAEREIRNKAKSDPTRKRDELKDVA